MAEDRNMELNEEDDTRLDEIRDHHWRDVPKKGDDKMNIHDLKWEVYV